MVEVFWTSSLDLETPAGRMLRQLASLLPPDREFTITLFSSAPLQIAVDPTLTSADVAVLSDYEALDDIVHQAGPAVLPSREGPGVVGARGGLG